MASVVDICNTALSHIGDSANVASIDPPDGSSQAGYCATFYPIALAALLEMATWGFATLRVALAEVDNPTSTWAYAYKCPSNSINLISVLSNDALDDYSESYAAGRTCFPDFSNFNQAASRYTPQPYAAEIDSKGNQIILTNQVDAVLRYTMAISDPTKFSPLFVLALSYLLASMLAGPIIKGTTGATMSVNMLKAFEVWEAKAEASDANQHHTEVKQVVSWMAGR